ncbi:MAG: GYD domain-containing protein [Chloroflexi bacterium]|nr:GYD domain-containing protein [Chloroflexota bacterium]
MPKYLVQANYVGEGVKGLLKEGGTSRRAAAEKLVKSLGGALEAFYYAFGETDAYIIAELPDNASMASLALTVSASGAVTAKTTVLMTPEEVDEAAKKAPSYRPPGQ